LIYIVKATTQLQLMLLLLLLLIAVVYVGVCLCVAVKVGADWARLQCRWWMAIAITIIGFGLCKQAQNFWYSLLKTKCFIVSVCINEIATCACVCV